MTWDKQTSSSHAQSPVVTVTVGRDEDKQKVFSLPQSLLRAKSPYFNRCLGGNFAESTSRTISLLDNDPAGVFMLRELDVQGPPQP